ncbi:MAG: hemin uptake protein HemP [Thiothrix sp.]|nr:MAG: hemin uptake protein HemP [Thiothrix sp.]
MHCLDLRRINVEEWMQGCKKVILQHGSRPYVLTITRRGKLILTAADTQLDTESPASKADPIGKA